MAMSATGHFTYLLTAKPERLQARLSYGILGHPRRLCVLSDDQTRLKVTDCCPAILGHSGKYMLAASPQKLG